MFLFQFIEWSLATGGSKLQTLNLHEGAFGPFILANNRGVSQVQTPKGKLFAFSRDHQHVITCAGNNGCIYKVKPCACDCDVSSGAGVGDCHCQDLKVTSRVIQVKLALPP